ncbi:MAG: Do family serine endopeptidase, partial [Thermohalobaculum sp.]|nr:Do family serine endopeptidase [Thermohalobaculum sp.]
MSLMRPSRPQRAAVPLVLGALAAAAIVWTPLARADTPPGAIADLVERVSPAVVTVLATPEAPAAVPGPGRAPFGEGSPFEEFFRRFGLPEGMPFPGMPEGGPHGGPQDAPHGVSLGSGFVIEADGYIVTNNHVVEDAAKVTVRFPDEREFTAEVIGTDPQTDLALLKIDADGLPRLGLGDSDALRVGEDVIAVGNPFGLGGTVTRGIVSALARDIQAGPYLDFIQTDAAINRGNSGGPLLNLAGEVIGVNSAIYSPNGGSVGVGFAIPANVVSTVVAQLRDQGTVARGWLGVSIQPVTPGIADALGLDAPRGAIVSDVIGGSPADGKLQSGDVILGFGEAPIEQVRDLPKLVAAARPGDTAKLTVLRDGHERTVTLSLGRLDAERFAAAQRGEDDGTTSDRLGATLAPLTPELRDELRLDPEAQGVVV